MGADNWHLGDLWVMEATLTFLLCFNVAFQLNLAYRDANGALVTDSRLILEHYRSQGGYYEMLAAFPFSAIAYAAGYSRETTNWFSLTQLLIVIRVAMLEAKRLQVRACVLGKSAGAAFRAASFPRILAACCAEVPSSRVARLESRRDSELAHLCKRARTRSNMLGPTHQPLQLQIMLENSGILVLILISLIHVLACIWFYIGTASDGWFTVHNSHYVGELALYSTLAVDGDQSMRNADPHGDHGNDAPTAMPMDMDHINGTSMEEEHCPLQVSPHTPPPHL